MSSNVVDQLEAIERLLFLLGEKEQEIALLYSQVATGQLPSADPPSRASAEPLSLDPNSKGRALIVDASASVRVRVANTLLGRRLEVKTAADGIEALEHLRDNTFSLVVFDYLTPRVAPMDFVQVLRRRLPHIHLFVTVNDDTGEIKQQLMRAGVRAVLQKPVDLAKLSELITIAQAA